MGECVPLVRKEGSCEGPRKIALQDPHLGGVASMLKSFASFFLVLSKSESTGRPGRPCVFPSLVFAQFTLDHCPL